MGISTSPPTITSSQLFSLLLRRIPPLRLLSLSFETTGSVFVVAVSIAFPTQEAMTAAFHRALCRAHWGVDSGFSYHLLQSCEGSCQSMFMLAGLSLERCSLKELC